MNHPIAIAAALLLGDAALVDASNALKEPPAYKMFRATEDYRYLASDESWKYEADWFDPIKYMPLDADRNTYLTVGGEFRPRPAKTKQRALSENSRSWTFDKA